MMKKSKWIKRLAVTMMAAGMCIGLQTVANAGELPNGIYVGEENLGGLTREEAAQKVEAYIDSMAKQNITLEVDGSPVDTTAESLGFHWSNTDVVEETADAYAGGNLIRRFMNLEDLAREPVTLQLETSMDEAKVAAFVEEKCNILTAEAKDATITRENGRFVITPSVVGKKVDIDATKQVLDQALAAGLDKPIQVAAVVEEAQPRVTAEQLETIQDVLGTFSTNFSTGNTSRATNVRVGAGKINGHVLMPGEVLSGYECMQPLTTANGFATAASYENGLVVDSVGGGVCQISTTLYNAALLSEMEIVQRQNHSMIVTYVKPSNDAAIAGTYKDLKFSNPYDTPIYVEGGTSGGTLTFTIYGKETRPSNRTIKYVSETLSTTSPGDPITKIDPSLPPGKKIKEQSSHTGYKSRLWKYVYVDGVETEKEILHTDTYNASKAIYRVGPAAPAATAPAETPAPIAPPPTAETPAPTTPPPVTGPQGGPGVALEQAAQQQAQQPNAPAPGPGGPGV